jgi:hypothetical protein
LHSGYENGVMFGFEVELFIIDNDGFPALNSSSKIISDLQNKFGDIIPITDELGSFQIEINPGPWKLNLLNVNRSIELLNYWINQVKKISKDIRIKY